MPQLVASGSRNEAFNGFCIAHSRAGTNDFVALLVDSEDPVANIEETWAHLKTRDNWDKPPNAEDVQALLMTTCMETWIASDRKALREHFTGCLQENSLPHLTDMEKRSRESVQNALVQASRQCNNKYAKGKRSFELLEKLDPELLKQYLPSFVRLIRILGGSL